MVIWPGGTTKLPQDVLRLDPKNISIGWVIESAWATPVSEQESRMYAQQAVDEINDDLFLLPNTFLTLEVETVMNNAKTVEAHNAVEARAKAAGRPLAAFLAVSSSHMATIYAPQALVTVTQQSTGVPIVGFYTGAGVLSDSKQFPNFIRLYPPVSDTQHVFRKMLLKFGWRRVGLLCDKTDAYSKSFFDVMNGTDPSNPSNLQPPLSEVGSGGPYDDERLTIVHAELVDFGKDANVTADALVAAIKAKDVKVFILFGQTSFVDVITLHGLDRGIFGPGYQVFVSDDGVITDQMSDRSRAALDGAVQIAAASIAPEYTGLKRASSFWKRHPPTHPPPGSDTTVPFMVSGRQARFHDASLYDSIMLAAVSIEACLKAGCRAVGHGYEEAMPYFRAAIVDGVAGTVSTKAGSNDPLGRIFSVKVGKHPASRGLPDGRYTFDEVAVTSSTTADIQKCANLQLGEACSFRTAMPVAVRCFASSATSIDVEWDAAPEDATGLLDGYRVSAFANGEQVFANVNITEETRVTFTLDAANANLRLKPNLVYNVQVESLYDDATIRSNAATCQIPQNGLPCIPPDRPSAVDISQRQINSGDDASCPCLTSSQVFDNLNTSGYISGGFITVSGVPWPQFPADRYGSTYGGDRCASHDRLLAPDCADDAGKQLVGSPAWCERSWCFIDASACKLSSTRGLYFPLSTLAFSYETCGEVNSFSSVCECASNQFHTKGMPPAMDDPPLQIDGSTGASPKDWKCEACLEGARCHGGVADTLEVRPGYFAIRKISKSTGAQERPLLLRCRGGAKACPGGTSVSAATTSSVLLSPARVCENITTTNLGSGPGSFEAARLLQSPPCQCGLGGTGMLCQTCKSSGIVGGAEWVVQSSGFGCTLCAVRSVDAVTLIGAIFFGFVLLSLFGIFSWWYYMKPCVVETRFVDTFGLINELGAAHIAKDFFGASIGSGITKEVFVAAVVRQCGGERRGGTGARGDGIVSEDFAPPRRCSFASISAAARGALVADIRPQALTLWNKLDENGDGKVELEEFVTFVCDLREGKPVGVPSKHGTACAAMLGFASSVRRWWDSMKSQTLKAVIVAHFQLQSSITGSYVNE